MTIDERVQRILDKIAEISENTEDAETALEILGVSKYELPE